MNGNNSASTRPSKAEALVEPPIRRTVSIFPIHTCTVPLARAFVERFTISHLLGRTRAVVKRRKGRKFWDTRSSLGFCLTWDVRLELLTQPHRRHVRPQPLTAPSIAARAEHSYLSPVSYVGIRYQSMVDIMPIPQSARYSHRGALRSLQ